MAGYQLLFGSGSGTTTPAKSDGNYHSYFGFTTQANPSAQQLAQIRQQQAAQAMQNQVQQKAAPQHQTLLNKLQGAVSNIGKAGKAVVKPIGDVVTGQGGKAAHDTAQLSSDVTGGTVNQLVKGVAQAPGAVAGEIASQSKDPYVRAQGVQAVQGAQKKAFGTNDSGTIAKKIVGSTVGTASLFAGGGELAGAKTLLKAGAKVAGKQVAKDAAIGTTGNVAATVTQNPNASDKDLVKSGVVGGLFGAVAPHAVKVAGDAGRKIAAKVDNTESKFLQPAKDVVNTVQGNAAQGQNDLLQVKQNALLSKASSLETPQTSATHVPVTPHVAYEPTNPRVKTLIDSAQKQQQAVEAPMKAAQAEQTKTAASAEKAQADGQKIDRQIELLQAKGKDSETGLSNVDKTKLGHLQQDKAQVGATAPVEPVTKPVSESPNVVAPAKAEPTQPAVAKENATSTASVAETKPSTQSAAVHQESITSQPESKVSGSALKSEQKAVESGLVKSLGNKAQYDTGSYKVEAANAVKLAHDNPEEAKAIAMGQKPGNNTIHEVAVRHAVEQQAIKEKDIQTLLDLSKSTQHTATSEAAQRLGTEGYHADSTSPVDAIRQVRQARQAAFEKRSGTTADKAISKEVKAIRQAVPKTTVRPSDWNSFLERIKC